MKINKIITIILSTFLLYSCQGTVDALQGKKRSDSSDEFLVKKKNPLTQPPDYNELPVPVDQEQEQFNEENDYIKKILEINNNEETNTQNDSNSNTSLKKSILEKITD
jgi:hypothetical protein